MWRYNVQKRTDPSPTVPQIGSVARIGLSSIVVQWKDLIYRKRYEDRLEGRTSLSVLRSVLRIDFLISVYASYLFGRR